MKMYQSNFDTEDLKLKTGNKNKSDRLIMLEITRILKSFQIVIQ